MSSQTLSEEQKRRIEENKRKALAIRAAKNASVTPPATSFNNTPKSGSFNPSTPKSTNSTPIYQNGSKDKYQPQRNGILAIERKPASEAKKTAYEVKKTDSQAPKAISLNNFYGSPTSRPVTVNCVLISRDRFAADFIFNKVVVDALKTIPNRQYDPKTARWSFPLTEYNKVKTTLQSIKEILVIVIPLPNLVLKTFATASKQKADYKSIDLSNIDKALLDNLFPFQKEGVQFGVSKNGRCIIADDMGLGKTIQAIGIAHYYYHDWPLLVVCPSSMRYQWEQEIMNYLPNVPLTRIFVMRNSKEPIDNPLVLITSYDLMSKNEKQLLEIEFGVIILDESHSIKNMKTQRTKAAFSLIAKARRCILLSGTPALSRPMELYPQMKVIDSKIYSMKEFGMRYCEGKESKFGMDYTGCSNMEELKVLLEEKFMIRRLKANVLSQLPSKIRQVVVLDEDLIKAKNKTMRDFAEKLNDESMKGTERRGTLLQYYAETAKTKINAIKDYVCQVLEAGNKFLLFAHHKVVLDEVCKLLEEKQTYYIKVDGSVSSDARKSVCDQFQTEEKFRVAVLSITAASTGLTLTAANLVVMAELFWNPGILTQAEDRVHRIGQQDSVLIQYLIARGTADDHLWPLIKAKLGILNQAGLSKDSFSCERTSMKTSDQPSIMDYFEDISEFEHDLSQILDEVEGVENKRIKLD
ncbi:SWI/SNF-related matrix-associated actin-dependent regulator of chromatin subfamily A-like protein 1 [Planococcus citri]|uniref:SWI/SNF-related matrix-associated actin-dependent regulator of chromatin subfamily A-like protein 1 n=1 Tax=Planococcus citri TaxID=170843 RepID=UPI0031F898FE